MDKTLYLVRGVPGSGKSTLAKKIAWFYDGNANMVCADDYMTDESGAYKFDAHLLTYAHESCALSAEGWMTCGSPAVIVHNTFTQNWEMKPYLDLAKKYGYSVFVVRCENQFGNVHGVPDAKVQQMVNRFEDRRY